MKNLLLNCTLIAVLTLFSVNTAAQQFTDVTTQYGLDSLLVKLGKGRYSWADYNNDGKLELLFAGDSIAVKITRIYALNQAGTRYRDTTTYAVPGGLIQVATPAIAWGDYNNDGYLDFAISGFTGPMGGGPSFYTAVTLVYKNNGDGTFTQQNFGLQGVDLGSLSWGDYNHDGKLDLLVMGRYGNAKNPVPYAAQGASWKVTKLYIGDGTNLVDAGLTFNSAEGGTANLVDLDNDGWLDIYLAGYATAHATYINQKNGTFGAVSNRGLGTGTCRSNTAVFADYNNDGYRDVLESYVTSTGTVASNFRVCQGSSTTFTADATFVPGFGVDGYYNWGSGELAMADYDNDGYQDFFAAGYQNVGGTVTYYANLFHNKGTSNTYGFTDTTAQAGVFSTVPVGVYGGSAQWIDFNNDNKLDLFFGGSLATNKINRGRLYLFQNSGAKVNTAPAAPTNLTSTVDRTDVTFKWDASIDAETPQPGITYELRVGSISGGVQIVCPFSDPSTGFCKIPQTGPLNDNDRSIGYLLRALPAGTYYWSVHAIDGGLLGGPWATEGTFTIAPQQASNIVISNLTSTSTTISWTNGSDANRSVFMKRGVSAAPFLIDSAFVSNSVFGTAGSNYRTTGWYCVYDGSGSTVDVTGLTADTAYTVVVLEYSGSGATIRYNSNTSAGNPKIFSTYSAPTTQASAIVSSNVNPSGFTLAWTNGDGRSRAVFVYIGSTGTAAPVDFTSYNFSSVFKVGSQIGISGWYCVYNGKGSTVNVTGMHGEICQVMVCEYNGIARAEKYLTTTAIDNPVTINTTIIKTPQTITLDSVPSKTYGDEDFDPGATASSGLPVTYASDNNGVATIVDGKIHIVGGGICNIIVSQLGDATYDVAPNDTVPFIVNKADQTISFDSLPDKISTDAQFVLTATSSSTLKVTYSSSNESVATLNGDTVTITGYGSVTITAQQTGNTNYNAAKEVQRTFSVTRVPQSITFGPLPEMKTGDPNYQLSAMASSGLKIRYTCSDVSIAAIQGDLTNDYIHIFGVGTAIITASQQGNSIWEPATSVQQTLTVTRGTTSLDEFGENGFRLYPNPVKDKLTVSLAKWLPKTSLHIYSCTGQEISVVAIDNALTDIDLSNLVPGLYIIKITSSEGVLLKQIIKQ